MTFTVPERGWTFEATYVPLPDEPCGRRITLPVRKTGAFTFVVEPGMRIAQLVVVAVPHAELRETEALPASERGEGGFGSSGRH